MYKTHNGRGLKGKSRKKNNWKNNIIFPIVYKLNFHGEELKKKVEYHKQIGHFFEHILILFAFYFMEVTLSHNWIDRIKWIYKTTYHNPRMFQGICSCDPFTLIYSEHFVNKIFGFLCHTVPFWRGKLWKKKREKKNLACWESKLKTSLSHSCNWRWPYSRNHCPGSK